MKKLANPEERLTTGIRTFEEVFAYYHPIQEQDVKQPLNISYYGKGTQIAALAVLAELRHERIIGFDVETYPRPNFRGDPEGGLDPYRSFVRLWQFATPSGKVIIIDDLYAEEAVKVAVKELLEAELPVKVGHNLKFDVKQAKVNGGVKKFGRRFCTDICHRVIAAGTVNRRVRLLEVASKYLNVNLDKTEQRSDWSNPLLTDEQLRYAGMDAFIVLAIREGIIKAARKWNLMDCLLVEMNSHEAQCDMELAGLPFDADQWLRAEFEIKDERIRVAEAIETELEDINPVRGLFEGARTIKLSSAKEMVHLLEMFGIDLPNQDDPKDTREDKPRGKTTVSWKLKPLGNRYSIIKNLLFWRELQKRKTSYGKAYVEKYVNPVTKRIHSSFDPLTTTTGRFVSAKPNLQQIPRIPVYRKCFHPTSNFVMVVGDYSQIELRTAAQFSGERGFIDAFNRGEDLHDATTLLVFGDIVTPPPPKGTPERAGFDASPLGDLWIKYRTYAKNINFGILYSMGAKTLAIRTGLSEEEAASYLAKYHESYPQLSAYLKEAGLRAVDKREIRTWCGRREWLRFDKANKADLARARRKGANTEIQGSCGDMMKVALTNISNQLYLDGLYGAEAVEINNCVHDEIVLVARQDLGEYAKAVLHDGMKQAGEQIIKVVPVVVEPVIAPYWSK